jgi:hypothetical protein
MKVEWPFNRCIICQLPPVLPNKMTEEHVIPAALSGKLKADFLCKNCNDKLGERVDHTACSDLEIRRAALEMPNMPQDRLTKINQRLNERQRFVLRLPGQPDVEAVAKGDLIQPVTFVNARSRLVQPTDLALKELRRFMLERGKSEAEIRDAIDNYKASPVGEDIEPTPGFVTHKHSFENATLHTKGSPVRSLLMLKSPMSFWPSSSARPSTNLIRLWIKSAAIWKTWMTNIRLLRNFRWRTNTTFTELRSRRLSRLSVFRSEFSAQWRTG